MPVTLEDLLTRVRDVIDEELPNFWTNPQITNWINDGARDLARKAEDLIVFDTSITIIADTYLYALPADSIRIHRCEFVPTGSTQTYPMVASTFQEMDQVWGTNQQTPSSYPTYWVLRGYPGGSGSSAFIIQLYPVPSQGGTLNVFYYKLPHRFLNPDVNASELAVTLDIPEGWDDLVVTYAEWRALRKARDPRWVEAKQLYDQELDYLINVTRQYHDQQQMITTSSRSGQPSWLYEFME